MGHFISRYGQHFKDQVNSEGYYESSQINDIDC